MYKRILIATDGSDLAQKGVLHGLSLAKFLNAHVSIITVTKYLPTYSGLDGWMPTPGELSVYDASQKQIAEKILTSVVAQAAGMGLEVDTIHVPDALAADAIIEIGQARHCDLIVMASHGRRGLARMVLGSQTFEVLSRSHIPILVVR